MTVKAFNTVTRLCLIGLCLLLAACSKPQPQLLQLAPDATILAFGDSITHGNGDAAGADYPAVPATLTGRSVINAGNAGEVTADGRARLAGLLARHRPALLLLCHGGNDLLRRIDPVTTRRNIETMIDLAESHGVQVMLIGVPQPGLFMLDAADLYAEIATRRGLLYAGDILPAVYSDRALKADPIHPNAAGYRRIAESIHGVLLASGAL